jgi:hypothetical protein
VAANPPSSSWRSRIAARAIRAARPSLIPGARAIVATSPSLSARSGSSSCSSASAVFAPTPGIDVSSI